MLAVFLTWAAVSRPTHSQWFTILSEILKSERDFARKIYDQEQEEIRQTIAFGRRSQGPPDLFFPSATTTKKVHPRTEDLQLGTANLNLFHCAFVCVCV